MSERPIRQARHDSDGDITAIGNIGTAWSPVSLLKAIADIETGTHHYYVPWTVGPHTDIRVVRGPHGKYLRTDRDSTDRNNLDDLPEC